MKKNLLFAAALMAALTASAQIEVGFINAESFNLGDKPVLAENTVLAQTENVTMLWENETQISSQNPAFNGFKQIIVNGQAIDIVTGVGGEVNPTAVELGKTPTRGGVQYHFEVKADGWLIVPSKISSNKPFYAYEGNFTSGMTLIAYTLGMDLQSADYPDIPSIVYTLPADEMGYCDLESPEMEKFTFGATALSWPIRIETQNADAATGGNGTGVLMFPVYAEAKDYYCFATGSKMNTCGFIFVPCNPEEEKPSVSLYCAASDERAEKTVVVTDNGNNGVEAIEAAAINENAPIYNALGVRVDANAKGLLIQNGKKFIRK